MPPSAVFNPLNGKELEAVILDQIRRKLDENGAFRQHISYPYFKIEAHIKVTCFDRDPGSEFITADVEQEVVTVDEKTGEGFVPPEGQAPKVLEVEVSRNVATPDHAREVAGLAISSPQEREGQIVDVPKPARAVTIKNRAGMDEREAAERAANPPAE